jgi:hypothetical protein
MQDHGDGLHHQGSFAAFFSTSDLSLRKNHGQNSGHSFDNRLIHDGQTFVSLDLGDNYPRGIILHQLTPQSKVGRVVFTYKTALGKTPHPHRKGPDGQPLPPGKWSNDNRTYTELGDVIPTPGGYLVTFASEKSTDNSVARGELNEPRNVGMVLVNRGLAQIAQRQYVVSRELIRTEGESSPFFGFFTFDGGYVAQQNTGVVWLTRYQDKLQATAARPKAVDLGGGRYLVLWEEWAGRKFTGSKALVISELGKREAGVLDLGAQVRLPRGERLLLHEGCVVWPAVVRGKLGLYAWKLKLPEGK